MGYTHRTKQNFVCYLQQAGFFVHVPALGDLRHELLFLAFDAFFWMWFIGCFLSVVHFYISDGKKFYSKKCLKLKKTQNTRVVIDAETSYPSKKNNRNISENKFRKCIVASVQQQQIPTEIFSACYLFFKYSKQATPQYTGRPVFYITTGHSRCSIDQSKEKIEKV